MFLKVITEISLFLFVFTVIIGCASGIATRHEAEGHSLSLVPNKSFLTPGSEVIVTCRMKSNLEPTVEWFRNGEQFTTESFPNGRVNHLKKIPDDEDPESPAYTSVLKDIPETEGNYIYACLFRTDISESRSQINIVVAKKPTITSLTVKPSTPQPKGRNITATCEARSNGKLVMQWFYVDDFDARNHRNEGLEILDEDLEDSFDIQQYTEFDEKGKKFVSVLYFLPVLTDANYTCRVEDAFGRATKKLQVKTVDLKIGEPCKHDLECSSSIRNADCIGGICACPEEFSILVKSRQACLTPVAFKGKCEHNHQCKVMDEHTYCTLDRRETCQCMDGFPYSVAKRKCIRAKDENSYKNVLLAIGASLFFIVSATLVLYFTRKILAKRRFLNKIKQANMNLGAETVIVGSNEENGRKKVHFTQ